MTGKKLSADGERPVLHIEVHAWERFRGIFHRQLPLMYLCSNISSSPAYRGLCLSAYSFYAKECSTYEHFLNEASYSQTSCWIKNIKNLD